MNEKPICIYHANCADGFAAAWAVRKFFADRGEEVDFHPGIYGEAPPDVTGRTVVIVDFSYPRDALRGMIEQGQEVVLIDHHKSTIADVQTIRDEEKKTSGTPCIKGFLARLSTQKSGAMLTWEFLFDDLPPPLLFDHIQDRDLWQHRLPMTNEIIAALYSYPMEFEVWDQLIDGPIKKLEDEGRSILRAHRANVAAFTAAANVRTINWGGSLIRIANVPWMYASDVAGELAKGHPFAATYHDNATGRRWSLRSDHNGADVSLIAKTFGGGGHQHAAGFTQTREEALDFEVAIGGF